MKMRRAWLPALLGTLLAALAMPAHAPSGPVVYPRGIGADLGPTPVTLGVALRAGDNAGGLHTGSLVATRAGAVPAR